MKIKVIFLTSIFLIFLTSLVQGVEDWLPIRANNNLTTSAVNPVQVDFSSFGTKLFAVVFTSNNTNPTDGGAGLVTWSLANVTKSANSFQVKTENDTGGNTPGKMNWIAVRSGEYDLENNGRLKCGTTASVRQTDPALANATFTTSFSNTNYAIVCSTSDDADTPVCNPLSAFKTTSSLRMEIRDKDGAAEGVDSVDWCAMTYGNYTFGGKEFKAGSDSITSVGTFSIDFGADKMPNEDYVVIVSSLTVQSSGVDCQCDIQNKTINGFNGTCYLDNGLPTLDCTNNGYLDWIALEVIDVNLSFDRTFTSLVNTTNRTLFGFINGTLNNIYYNNTIDAVRLIYNNKTNGTYTSQVFDLGTTQIFNNISWTQGAPYGIELGRSLNDSVTASNQSQDFGFINTSGLVVLFHFNNESEFGENNSIIRDFSTIVNSERATSITANATCDVSCSNYSISNKILGNSGLNLNQSVWTVNTPSVDWKNAITISTWIYVKTVLPTSGTPSRLLSGDNSSNSDVIRFTITQGNGIVFSEDSGVSICQTSSNVLLNDTWHHIAITKSKANNVDAIYVDGIDKANDKTCTGGRSATYPRWTLGNLQAGTRLLNATIDEFSIWNRSLSQAEVRNLYKRGAMRLNLTVRSCDDISCVGEGFEVNATNSSFSNISNLTNNRYIQYQANLFIRNSSNVTSPELYNVTIHYQAITTADTTLPSGNLTTITNNSVYNSTKILIGSRWNETGDMRLYINWTLNQTELSVTAGTNFTFITNLSNGTYLVNATLTDSDSNIGETPFFIFKIANNTGVEVSGCTCPVSGNWNLNPCLGQTITTNCNLNGNSAYCTQAGTINFRARISNALEIFADNGCELFCETGDCW